MGKNKISIQSKKSKNPILPFTSKIIFSNDVAKLKSLNERKYNI